MNYKRLRNSHWKYVEDKVENKLGCWKGSLLTIEGRLTLVNSSLNNVPLYMLSFYKLPKGVKRRLDFFRARLLWQEDQGARKYHSVNWPIVCSPKDQGGLGVLDLEVMNLSLLGKWLWKLETENGLWQDFIKKKYLSQQILSQVPVKPGVSQLWQGIMAVKDVFLAFCKKKVCNGR